MVCSGLSAPLLCTTFGTRDGLGAQPPGAVILGCMFKKEIGFWVAGLAAMLLLFSTRAGMGRQGVPASRVVVAYVFPRDGALKPGEIDPHLITRINYAFANIKDGRMVLGKDLDAQNFAYLVSLRKENPALTVLVSVGGWEWSGGFSDAAVTEQSRQAFIESVMSFLKSYALDGLDIDWEYPGLPGAGHKFRAEDGANFTVLLKELRGRFDKETAATGRRLYLTIAAGASDEYLQHTEMAKAQEFVDTVNLMAYDYSEAGSDRIANHHAPLYTNPASPKKESADTSVRAFEAAGVPAGKIVLGVPFYGHLWGAVGPENHGLFQPGKPVKGDWAPYGAISTDFIGNGYVRYWDAAAKAPYLYNAEKKILVSYEDEESLAVKCDYILSNRLGGVMFWEYSGDPKGVLLRTIDGKFHEGGLQQH
jgi:chitinase